MALTSNQKWLLALSVPCKVHGKKPGEPCTKAVNPPCEARYDAIVDEAGNAREGDSIGVR